MKIIKLTNGQDCLVDDADFEFLNQFTWSEKGGYAVTYKNIFDRTAMIRMHRLIMAAPSWAIIDHKSGATLDNQRSNLRFCHVNQNSHNSKKRKSKTKKFKGVYKATQPGKWWARITHQKKQIFLGVFETEEGAFEAYKAASVRLYGPFSPYREAC